MGHKRVCFHCRISKNISVESVIKGFPNSNCTKCNRPMMFVNHSFRPPKRTDLKAWMTAKYLVDNGFPFRHVYQEGKNDYSMSSGDNYVPYPKTLKDAEEFVKKYKSQSKKRNT